MLKKLQGSTLTLIVGIALFGIGAYKFTELAILPRFAGTAS